MNRPSYSDHSHFRLFVLYPFASHTVLIALYGEYNDFFADLFSFIQH